MGKITGKTSRVTARFAFPAVGLIVAGAGYLSAGRGSRTAIGPGTLFGVYPGTRFDYAPEPWWDEYYIGFAGPGAAELLQRGLIPQKGRPRYIADVPAAVVRFEEIMRLWRRAGPGDADRAALAGQCLLLDLFTGNGRRAEPATDPIERVLAHCRARPQDDVDFVSLAARYDISYSFLRQGVRRRTGLPPAKYLTRLRCEAACVQLATTSLSIKRIARNVGIADPYAFSRTFARTIGHSPTQYRLTQYSYGLRHGG